MNLAKTSPFSSRARFFVNVVGSWSRPDRQVQAHKPPIQQIVVQLLHQLPFRTEAVEHLQGAQQLSGGIKGRPSFE